MALKTSNNVKKIIAVPVAPTDTTITLVDVIGLPNVSDPADWTILTLIRLSDMKQEIVQVDDIVGNVLTVQRAQEGTAALSFIGNDQARNFFTAGMFNTLGGIVAPPLPPASETVAGIMELATQAETNAGTDDLRAVTPLKLETRLSSVLPSSATESVEGLVELATQAETDAGTNDTRAITPLKLENRLAGLGSLVNSGSNANGYYRVYSDGFIEQWGTTPVLPENASTVVPFPISFVGTNYHIDAIWKNSVDTDQSKVLNTHTPQTSQFTIINAGGSSSSVAYWSAQGY